MDIFDIFKKLESGGASPSKKEISMIIACLGNPGDEYKRTRHNVGFMCADVMREKYGFDIKKAKFRALYGEADICGKRAIVMLPQTYMNNSGEAIRAAADFYNLSAEKVLVIVDDIALDVGNIRIRNNGSDGGHNGLKSIIKELGSSSFPRIRIGVGKKPHPDYDLIKWVLGDIPSAQNAELTRSLENAADAVGLIISGQTNEAMNKYNKKAES